MKDMHEAVTLAQEIGQGRPLAEEQVYEDALQSILRAIEKRQGDVTKVFNQHELLLYCRVLMAMLLTERYSFDRHSPHTVHSDLTKISQYSR
jgi:hypothetical protein